MLDPDDVEEAIQSAQTAFTTSPREGLRPLPRHEIENVRSIVLAVVRELPEDATIRDLREVLEQ